MEIHGEERETQAVHHDPLEVEAFLEVEVGGHLVMNQVETLVEAEALQQEVVGAQTSGLGLENQRVEEVVLEEAVEVLEVFRVFGTPLEEEVGLEVVVANLVRTQETQTQGEVVEDLLEIQPAEEVLQGQERRMH